MWYAGLVPRISFVVIHISVISSIDLISGVQLLVPDMINATEGEVGQFYVTIQDDDPSRERSVGISFRLHPMSK